MTIRDRVEKVAAEVAAWRPKGGAYEIMRRALRDGTQLEINLPLSESGLNRLMAGDDYRKKLRTAGIEDLAVRVTEPLLVLEGRFDRNQVRGTFRVDVLPTVRAWQAGRHVIVFEVRGKDVKFEGVLGNALHAVADATARLFTGKDAATAALRATLGEQEEVEVALDGISGPGDAVLDSVDLLAVRCAGERVNFRLKLIPSRAVKNSAVLLSRQGRALLAGASAG